MKLEDKELIEASKISLEEWLNYISVPKEKREYYIIDYQFVTDEHFEEYISTISKRTDQDVKFLLRHFLIINDTSLNSDKRIENWLYTLSSKSLSEKLGNSVFLHKLFTLKKPWTSIAWVLDLLPNYPDKLISVLEAYSTAHIAFFPDGKFTGFHDAIEIIKAKYMNHFLPVSDVIKSISSRDFELLVAYLYKKKKYTVKITPQTRDGGYDILSINENSRYNEVLYIECKRHINNIGVKYIRNVLGLLTIRNATKSVIVTSSFFTLDAQKAAFNSKRIELININDFDREMRTHVSYNWTENINTYINEMKISLLNIINS